LIGKNSANLGGAGVVKLFDLHCTVEVLPVLCQL